MHPGTAFKLRSLLPFMALATGAAYASDEDSVVREYTFPLSGIEEVEFHASVGNMEIIPIDADEIRLVLEI